VDQVTDSQGGQHCSGLQAYVNQPGVVGTFELMPRFG